MVLTSSAAADAAGVIIVVVIRVLPVEVILFVLVHLPLPACSTQAEAVASGQQSAQNHSSAVPENTT